MLPVERVLALDHARMPVKLQLLAGRDQALGDREIRNSRILDRGVLAAGTVLAHRSGGDDNRATHDGQLDATAGSHADKSVTAALAELLDGDRGGRPADTGRADSHRLSLQGSVPDDIFAVLADKTGVLQMPGDFFHPSRVSRKDHVAADVSLLGMQMVLDTGSIHIIRHGLIVAQPLPGGATFHLAINHPVQ